MYSKAPTATFPSYELASGVISIDVADLTGLTEAEANATTGDVRRIAKAILDKLLAVQEAAAVADRSARMVVSKGVSLLDANTRQDGYSLNFQVDLSDADVKAE